MRERDLEPGDLLGQDLVIEARAGAGGTATVYRARRASTGARVAAKVMTSTDHDWARLVREHAALASVDHPGLVRVIELGTTDDGRRYAVLPWCDGQSLAARLVAPGLTAAEGVALVAGAAEVIAVAHAVGVVHRDLKPGHVWARVDGTVAVIDFGIARGRHHPQITRTGTTIGTPGYMAPEQITGAAIDPRADVFALGCICYEALAGAPPFAGSHVAVVHGKILWAEPAPLRDRCPEASPALAALVRRMLAKAPTDRPANAGEVAAALAAIGPIASGPRRRRDHGTQPTQRMARPQLLAVGLPTGAAAGPVTPPAIALDDGTAIALVDDDASDAARAAVVAALGSDRLVAMVRTDDLDDGLARCVRAATRAAATAATGPLDLTPGDLHVTST